VNKSILKLGLLSGVLLTGFMLLSMPFFGNGLDYGVSEFLGYISMIIAMAPIIFIGIKSTRDKESGKISYLNAVKVGFFITLITSVIYVVGWVTYLNTSDNNFMENYSEYVIEKMDEDGESADAIAEKSKELIEFTEMYQHPLVQIGFTFLEVVPVGLLISLIAAGILAKK